jgi:DNA recombination protein RmuC
MPLEYVIIALVAVLTIAVVIIGRKLAQPAADPRLETIIATLDQHRQALERLGAVPERVDDVRTRLVAGGEQQKHLQEYLAETRRTIEEMHRRLGTVAQSEDKNAELLDRLHRVLLGGSSRGRKGENLLREQLAAFPPSMLAMNYKIGTQTVEFALRLPDERVIPIDSKWPEPQLVEKLESITDAEELARHIKTVESKVLKLVAEVKKYIDPEKTAPLVVAALPDSVYALAGTVHYNAYKSGVLLVAYSNAVPFLLAIYGLFLRYAQTFDMEQVKGHLSSLETFVAQLENVIDNQLARGGKMVTNAADECRNVTVRMRRSLAAVSGVEHPPAKTDTGEPDIFNAEDNR